jgi:tripartite-type tricarboxylate transporter receptor subunit TctC
MLRRHARLRAHIKAATAILAVGLALTGAAGAQAYPDKVIKFIVPSTPGSVIDVIARLVAQPLSRTLGQSVIVEHRAGAAGTIGANAVATASPDGHTLLFTSTTHVISAAMFNSLPYDPIKSFAAVGTVATASYVLVVPPSVPANSIQEFIAYAKANPGKLNFGFGLGTAPHMVGEMLKVRTGLNIASIPYRGGQLAVTDMLGGTIHMNFGTTATLLPLIREGKVKALAVTGATRDPDLPNVPTMAESGLPELSLNFWVAVLAPERTPDAIVTRLNTAISNSLKSPEIRASFAKLGFESKIGSPEGTAEFVIAEMPRWAAVVKQTGVKID